MGNGLRCEAVDSLSFLLNLSTPSCLVLHSLKRAHGEISNMQKGHPLHRPFPQQALQAREYVGILDLITQGPAAP